MRSPLAPFRLRGYRLAVLLLSFILIFTASPAVQATEGDETIHSIARTIKHLASLEGRSLGAMEGRAARDFIASRFKEMGLESVSNASFQQFHVTVRNLGNHALLVDGKPLPDDDFVPLAFTVDGKVQGETVFVNHGMGDDDYEAVDVKGKVVVALAGTPIPGSRKEANEAILQKYREARRHGAIALVLVDDKPFESGYAVWPERIRASLYEYWKKKAGDDLEAMRDLKVTQYLSMLPMPEEIGIPVIMASTTAFDFRAPRKIALTVEVNRRELEGNNVIGLLRGSGSGGELLIVGAHYDHLGKDPKGRPFPGGDDNASGVAALLQVARSLSGLKSRLKMDILFIAFDGEEWGLRGSSWYVDHPLFPLDKTIAMLNMDTVGRNNPGEIYLVGARQNPDLFPLVVEEGREAGLVVLNTLDFAFPWGSDHYPFFRKGVPAVDFSSSLHDDYHRITDTADKVDFVKVGKVADLVTRLALRIAENRLHFPKPLDVVVPYPSRSN